MRPFWFWCIFPAITMSLGWGLRGSIGGGPLGAMIPGAMIGLALCLLLGRQSDAAWIAAFSTIGVGFGGQETYGQTVGLSLHPETFWWAITGFAVKGAAWGLLGGAFLGMALSGLENKRIITGLLLMVAGTWLGWKFIDDPKLIYFSNRVDRPREELWAGLSLGGLCLLAWLRARVPWCFALYGATGGAIGFAFGAALQPWGKGVWANMPLGWWKAMELTFGAMLGFAYGACAWRLRRELSHPGSHSAPAQRGRLAIGYAILAVALTIFAEEALPIRFGFTLGGAVLAGLVLFSDSLAWQSAITATYASFTADLVKHQNLLPQSVMWAWVVATTAILAFVVARHAKIGTMFLLLTWTAVGTAFRYALPPQQIGIGQFTMLGAFVVLAIIATFCCNGLLRSQAMAGTVVAVPSHHLVPRGRE
jgi:hypothetical protein